MAEGAEVEIAAGRSASFEIVRDGELVFSKLALGRFPEDDEVRAMARG